MRKEIQIEISFSGPITKKQLSIDLLVAIQNAM